MWCGDLCSARKRKQYGAPTSTCLARRGTILLPRTGRFGTNRVTDSSGAQVFSEILGQPHSWIECFKTLREQGALAKIRQKFPSQREWVFIGCGSSYYVAQVAAASWALATGGRA